MDPSGLRSLFESNLGQIKWHNGQGKARCPFHPDRRASLSVNSERGLFLCHACGAKGNWRVFKELLARKQSRRDRMLTRKRKKWNKGSIVATYAYTDRTGKLLFEQVRFQPKDFRFRRPDGAGGWFWNLTGVEKVPYRLPEVSKADHVYIPEGEKDVETLRSWGLCATCNPGGAGKWNDEYSRELKDKTVVVLQDNDVPGRKHAYAVAQSAAKYATEVKLVPPFKGAKDVSDWIESGGTKQKLERVISSTPVFKRQDSAAAQTRASDSPNINPSIPILRGDELLVRLENYFKRYVVLPSGVPLVLALWVISSHIFESFHCSPYLCITSPTKQCGKTLCAELIGMLSARPLYTVGMSEAALFRSIESFKPTLIMDEAESLHRQSERALPLIAILNAGHRKGTPVVRCVGRDYTPTKFSVFCPKVVIAIGLVSDTIRDRSIVVSMKRKGPNDQVRRYRYAEVSKRGAQLAKLAEAWACRKREKIETLYGGLPLDFLKNREADVWEPIFAVAEIAAPGCLQELRSIALRLTGEKNALDVDESLGLRLLADCKAIFNKGKRSKLSTDDVIAELKVLPESIWEEILPAKLARLLRPYGVRPQQLWIRGDNVRGYDFEDFKPVFETYLGAQDDKE